MKNSITLAAPREIIISDLTLAWAKLVKPSTAFDVAQFELQISTTDPKKVAELEAAFITLVEDKKNPGTFTTTLRRRETRADGTLNTPVDVIDEYGDDVDKGSIGNGSVGNLMLFQAAYDSFGRSGVVSTLQGVQITELVAFERASKVAFELKAKPEAKATFKKKVKTKAPTETLVDFG